MLLNTAEIGDTETYKGQPYRCVDIVDHQRSDGSLTKLKIWETACATCQVVFRFGAPLASDRIWPSRRCDEHKRPGRAV
ncbi:hypothetical protein ACRQ5Q_24395 [Bradyrhizobium sp. PMVTL-01]|uniref:hypothetical protein n=1 Tax=Bradyrhizobium sp. PMVTL-01 TaxID=3434999 RepID=UPI003F71E265